MSEDILSRAKKYANQIISEGIIRDRDLFVSTRIELTKASVDPEASELLNKLTMLEKVHPAGLPDKISKYLTSNEIVDKQYHLENQTVYVLGKRLLIEKGDSVRDIRYNQISSTELQATRKWSNVFIGILLIAMNLFYFLSFESWISTGIQQPEQRLMNSGVFGWLFVMIIQNIWWISGIYLVIKGFLRKTHRIKFSVAGMTKEQVLSGNRDTLDDLIRLVNERRIHAIDTTSEISNATKTR